MSRLTPRSSSSLRWDQVTVPVLTAAAGWLAAVVGLPLLAVAALAVLATLTAVSYREFRPTTQVDPDQELRESETRVRAALQDLRDQLDTTRRRSRHAAAGLAEAADVAMRMEEDVRATITAELHDTVTQTLVAAAYATYDPDVPRERLTSLMQEAETELRSVMLNQSPLTRVGDSVGHQVTVLADRMRSRHRLDVQVTEWPEEDLMLPYASALTLYRFIHEGVTNVAKHAQTSHAWVSVRLVGEELVAQVRDDGVGFDPAQTDVERLGLSLMRKRCAVVAGDVEVSSTPGAGVTLTLRLPYRVPEARPDCPQATDPQGQFSRGEG